MKSIVEKILFVAIIIFTATILTLFLSQCATHNGINTSGYNKTVGR